MLSSNFTILDNSVFDNFILADKLFAKALHSLKACVTVDNNLSKKLILSLKSPVTFDERFNVTSVKFFIPAFNLLSCHLDNFIFKVLY